MQATDARTPLAFRLPKVSLTTEDRTVDDKSFIEFHLRKHIPNLINCGNHVGDASVQVVTYRSRSNTA